MILLQILAALASEQPVTPGSWCKVAVHESGVVATVCTLPGPDIGLRIGNGPVQVVNTYTLGVQDEPDIAATAEGFIVAWDQRDPVYMHTDLRCFDVAGHALGAPIQIDEQSTAWRPLLAVRNDGLVACLFTGGFDNNSYVRFYSAQSAAWLGGSSLVGTNPNGDQEDPAGVWLSNGDLFCVWLDFHGGGFGIEPMYRVSRDMAWLNAPARLVPQGLPGNQRFPVCCTGNDGIPWTCWQDTQGAWLKQGGNAPVLIATGATLPSLAASHVVYERAGDVWEWPSGQRLNRWTPGLQQRPSTALAPDGTLWATWSGPMPFANSSTCFLRAFGVQP